MRKKHLVIMALIVSLYIAPIFFMGYSIHTAILTEPNTHKDFAPSAFWFNTAWLYRKELSILNQSGAGSNYQITVIGYYDDNTKDIAGSIDFEGLCQTDFDDIVFTSSNGVTRLDFYRDAENYSLGVSALFWVNVTANCSESGNSIYCYFGNPTATTLSDPDATFLFFDDFENNNLNKWTIQGAYWSTTTSQKKFGSYGAFADAGTTTLSRELFTTVNYASGSYKISCYVRNIEVGNYYKWGIHLTDENNKDVAGIATYSNDWIWHNGSIQYYEQNTVAANTWYKNEFAFTIGGDCYAWINGAFKGSHTLVNFTADVANGITNLGSLSCDVANKDSYLDHFILRKWVLLEPSFDAPSALEANTLSYAWESVDSYDIFFVLPEWVSIDDLGLIFSIPVDETFLNWALIFLGLAMIPSSSLYLVWGGRNGASMNKLFWGLIAFALGWGLVLGVIYT